MVDKVRIPSGRFGSVSNELWQRLNHIARLVRLDRERFEALMAPDQLKLHDVDGMPYWGSTEHLIETAVVLLERKLLGPPTLPKKKD